MIGNRIRRIRTGRKITQKKLADTLGVSRQAISMWESGRRELKATTLQKIARVLGVSVDEIMAVNKDPQGEKEGVMFKQIKRRISRKKKTFTLFAPDAKQVFLTGCFKDWATQGIPMKKQDTGEWKISVPLKPGRYAYKFVVDDQWLNDPANEQTIDDGFGAQNSLAEVG